MVIDALGRDWRAKTYSEFSAVNVPADGRRPWSFRSMSRYGIRMKPLDQVANILGRSRYPLVVLKPLVESQHAPAILDAIDDAMGLWVFRHYRDVARSNVKLFTPQVGEINLEPIVRREPGNWRSELVPDDVRDLISRHYSPEMSPYDGAALFWYARNRLLFDLGLDQDERLMTLLYDDLAADPETTMGRVYTHLGISFPGSRITEKIHPRSIGRGQDLQLSTEVGEACDALWARLVAAYERQGVVAAASRREPGLPTSGTGAPRDG